jgi:hypothetical protein
VQGIDLARYTSVAEYTFGALAFGKDGKSYRYVRFLDAVAYAAGHVVTVAGTGWQVTNDRSGGSAQAGLEAVGVCLGVPTQDQYGWVQVAGIATVLIEGAAVIAGDRLVTDETNDGAAREINYTTYAAIQERNVGTALATIGDGATGLVLLRGLI